MTRLTTLTACLLTLALTAMAWAQVAPAEHTDDCCPAPEAGVKLVSDEGGAPAAGAMPEGHPPIPGKAGGGMPPGHPPMPGMSGMPGMTSAPPTAQGTVIVRIKQGTEGGSKAVGSTVTLKVIDRGQIASTTEAKVAEGGLVVFDDVRLIVASRTVASIAYGGGLYEAIGPPVNTEQPDQMLNLTVYEPTEKQPDWKVTNRHLMLQAMPGGVVVNDIFMVSNPSDHSWLGRKLEDDAAEGKALNHKHDHATIQFKLPEGARSVQLAPQFSPCCSTVKDGVLLHYGPMKPGVSQFRVQYVLPVDDGQVDIPIEAFQDTNQLMVFAGGGTEIEVDGLTEGEPMGMGQRVSRRFDAKELTKGQSVSITLKNLPQPRMMPQGQPQSQAEPPQQHGTPLSLRVAASVGGGGILVLGSIMVMLRKP